MSVVVMGLAGFGATAFGIAPMAPDAADLPRRIVTESVTPSDVQTQLDALAQHELELYRSDLTRSSDTADSLLRRLNVDDPNAAVFIRSDAVAHKLLAGRAGKMVQVRVDASGELEELVARSAAENSDQFGTHFTRLRISRVDGKLRASVETAPLAAQVRMGSGTIRNSLFAATDEARIPDPVASQMADIFGTDIDFHRELRRGDRFTVIYEALTADGEPITWNQSSGRVLAAEFVNNGKTYSAVWFKDASADSKGGYFDINGESKRRAFLASPMEFSRVTSGFAMRFHPILQTWKQHNGVDYGAPMGTAVRSVGDGVVDFAGWQNGYGNVVQIKHSNERSTVYAHLSRIDVRKGQRVEQGARVGAVGMTGWATGPHLHFEVKLRGQQQNPLTIAKSSEAIQLAPTAKAQFAQLALGVRAQLEAAETVSRSSAYSE
ncbi:MAG: M23 family metallopeptidase [Betaproteobacteria bacterium]|nr:MAG: M23 family metallopeptidase [Betaproteobacteria bacterium]